MENKSLYAEKTYLHENNRALEHVVIHQADGK